MEIKLLQIPEPHFKGCHCHMLYPSWGQMSHLGTFFCVSAFSKWLSPCKDSSSIIWQAVWAQLLKSWNFPSELNLPPSKHHLKSPELPGCHSSCHSSHEKRRLETSSSQGNSFNSHFSSCSLRLRTRPSPFLWASGMDGNGQDRQMEPLVGPAVGISGNCLSEDKIIKTEELKSLWECFSSSLLLQDRAG